MSETDDKILFVDDEPMLLSSIQRMMRKHFPIQTATSGAEALEVIQSQGPFAIVVSDMQMPEMNGVAFLKRVSEVSKDTIRMMLTGNADQNTAVQAINQGDIFRFIHKPVDSKALSETLNAGLQQYHLVTAEKKLLSRTLAGSIGVMSDVLSIVKPDIFGRSSGIRELVKRICDEVNPANRWEIELAASLCQLGYISLSETTLESVRTNSFRQTVSSTDFQEHASVGSNILNRIPRLNGVAELIRLQHRGFDGSGLPKDGPTGEEIPLGSRILKLAHDFDLALQLTSSQLEGVALLNKNARQYDPALLQILDDLLAHGIQRKSIPIADLKSGMNLESHIVNEAGNILLASGQVLNDTMIDKLVQFSRTNKIREPIEVSYFEGLSGIPA